MTLRAKFDSLYAMTALNPVRSGRSAAGVFWGAIILALAISFCLDFLNTRDGGAIDLRNRVTGVRLLVGGTDPYTYKWHHGDPDVYCDVYNNPRLPVSKTTATPALLLLHVGYLPAYYRLGEFTWLFAQWVALLGTGALWLLASPTMRQRQLVAIFLTALTYTAAWRLHAERGQAYILIAFVFADWLVLTLNPKWSRHWAVGMIAGFLVALRPPFLLLAPFMFLHRRAQLIGMAAGLFLGIAAPLLIHPASWSEYFAAMQLNSDVYRNGLDPRPGQVSYPATLEGTSTDLLANFAVIPYADFSVFALLRWMGLDHSWLGHEALPAAIPLAVVAIGFSAWLWISRAQPAEKLLPALAAWLFLADLFLPAFRDSYNDVLVLDVVCAGLVLATRIPWAVWPCVIALPIGWAVYIFAPETVAVINLPTSLFTVGAVGFLFRKTGAWSP